jgi:pyrroline-5-carboxylate reductase
VFDPDAGGIARLKNDFPDISAGTTAIEIAASCEVVILAIHPPAMTETLASIKPFLRKDAVVISLAPKITIEKMKALLGGFPAIARVNPSAPGIVNKGINPVVFAESMNEVHKQVVLELLRPLGRAPVVDERKIEAYAVICAMGSTYFWFQLDTLKDLAVKFGMAEAEAKEVITEMMRGTVDTLFSSDIPAAEVMDLVPVKPIGEFESVIGGYYDEKLNAIYNKIKPA